MKTFNTGYWLSAATASVLMAAVAHAATWDQKIAEGAHQILIGDFNGDQHSDVLWQAKRPEDEHTAIFTAVTSANTQRWKDGHLSKVWSRKDVNVIVGDFNGDLNSDILLQSITPALTSELIITESSGHIGVPMQSIGDWHLGLRWDSNSSRAIVGDFNGDGRDDLFLHGKDKNRHGLALANEDGQFQKLEFDFDNHLHNLDWSDKNTTLNTGDFNGDGKYELLLQPTQSDGLVSTVGGDYQQGPLATITQQWSAQHLGFDWSSRRHRVVVGDFDGNGKDDVFLLGTTKIDASAYLTASENQFDTVKERIETIPNLDKLKDIIVADFDADGIDELLLMFDDKQHPLMLLLADGARRARLEALFRLNGLLNGKQTLGWLTGVVASTPITPSKSLANAAAVQQCDPQDSECEEIDCELFPTSPACTTPPPSPYNESISTVTESAYPAYSEFGIVNGTFRVDESGAATYAYPITTLPGTGGVAPKISLNYNSNSGNGLVGVGWNISGISTITRCRKTKETDSVDGSTNFLDGSINFDANDEYCLDGQRLILREGNRTSGSGPWKFRTEIDSFAQVTATGGTFAAPTQFTVERKDGSTSTYGATNDSKLELAAADSGSPIVGKVMTYAINKYSDKANNYILFDYTEINGLQRLAAVRYTGHENSSPTHAPYAKLQFNYEARVDTAGNTTQTDARTHYAFGGKVVTDVRLKSIDSIDGSTVVRTTKLSYAPFGRSPLSRLEFIQECSAGTCLPAIQFKWNVGLNRFETTFRGNNGDDFTHRYAGSRMADFNGDGKADLGWVFTNADRNEFWFRTALFTQSGSDAYFSTSTGEGVRLPHKDAQSFHLLDYDGDGRTDIMSPRCTDVDQGWLGYYCDGYGGGNWGVSLASATGTFTPPVNATNGALNQIDTGIPLTNSRYAQVADFNGDGRPDILYPVNSSHAAIAFGGIHGIGGHVCKKPESGRPFCFAEPITVSLSLGSSGLSVPGSSESALADISSFSSVDFNGDGYSDLMLDVKYTGTPTNCDRNCPGQYYSHLKKRALVAYKTDAGVLAFKTYGAVDILNAIDAGEAHLSKLADFNGDGLIDLFRGDKISDSEFRWYISLNKGDGFSAWNTSYFTTVDTGIHPIDLNNDGLADIVYSTAHDVNNTPFLVRFQNGDGTFMPAMYSSWVARSHANYRSSIFNDFDGDGIMDAAYLTHRYKDEYETHDQRLVLSQDKHKARNTISEIVTGAGNRTVLEYTALTRGSYTRGTGGISIDYNKHSAVFDLFSPMYVVSSARSSSPSAADNADNVNKDAMAEVRYHYEAFRMQAGGRGALGFKKIYSYDPESRVETETEYRQDFPYIGMAKNTIKRLLTGAAQAGERFGMSHAGSKNISESSNTLAKQATALGGYMPYVSLTLDKNYEPNSGALVARTQTTMAYDTWGNVDWITVVNQDSNGTALQTKITDNDFPTDAVNGFLGRLQSATVTVRRPGFTEEVRRSAFEYDNNNKQLTAEIIEPNDISSAKTYYLRTEHKLDIYGNRWKTIVRTHDSVASTSAYYINRVSTVEYDSKGRFIERKFNAFDQKVEEVIERNKFYAPTKVKGLNGVTLTSEFTLNGRLKKQSDDTGVVKEVFLEKCGGGISCPKSWHAYRTRTVNNNAPDSEQYFDVLGRESLSVAEAMERSDGDKIYKSTEYDVLSRVKRVSLPYFNNASPAGWTVNSYDAIGRLVLVANPDNTFATNNYSGFETTYTNEKGQVKTETRNWLGELVSVVDANSKSISYSYDIAGRLDTMTRVGKSDLQSDLTYDYLGRKTRMWDADKSPVSGSFWSYDYNALGEIVKQTDPRGYVTQNTYDSLGRLVNRLEKSSDSATDSFSNTNWTFDNESAAPGTSNSRGQLTQEEDTKTGYKRVPGYDGFGRVTTVTTTIKDGEKENTWSEQIKYDTLNRVDWTIDATGQGVKLKYTLRGFVEEKQDKNKPEIIYQYIEKMDHFGHVVTEKASSGALVTTRKYYPQTGRLQNVLTTGNGQTLQNLNYDYDVLANLKWREDFSSGRNLRETFDYDNLNRLIKINDRTYAKYDDEGNITQKADVTGIDTGSSYQYEQTCNGVKAGPHAVSSVEGHSYCYDRNGNQVSGKGRTLSYANTFDLPSQIKTNKHTTDFVYGPSHQRIKRVDSNTTTGNSTTYYVGNVEIISKGGKVEYRRNLGNAVVNNGTVSYLLTDHLGSTHRIVNCNGAILQNISFDAFGDKRSAETWDKLYADFSSVASMPRSTEWLLSPLSNSRTFHGYTGHEQLDELGLVHMNGRVYDPHLGRFLQADPVIQAPTNSQSLNRYSYIINNPLSGVDPSGFSWWMTKGRKSIGIIVLIVVNILCDGCAWYELAAWAAAAQAAVTYFQTGSTSAAFRAGAIAFISSAVGSQLGTAGDWTTIGKSAVFGGVMSVLQGGKFGHGFVSAGFTQWAGANWIRGMGNKASQTVAQIIVGGTASELSGGKFANGATTAAFQAMARSVADKFGDANDTPQAKTKKVSVIVEEPNPNDASKINRKGMSGHSAMAMNDEFWDYGPTPGDGSNLFGSAGQPWWDIFANPQTGNASYADALGLITAEGYKVSVFSINVSAEQAAIIENYWNELYADPGTYQFALKQCTTTVVDALNAAGLGNFSAILPSTLAAQLRTAGWKEVIFDASPLKRSND